ncbi:hypothetical protein HMPREF9278_0260 [Mobiluncus mulieris FB024-16]|nr:hypothetical protein HMPREF9278_0260 [Mobiluncus mulieris FB024-16]
MKQKTQPQNHVTITTPGKGESLDSQTQPAQAQHSLIIHSNRRS